KLLRYERRRPMRGHKSGLRLGIARLHAIEQRFEILRDGGDGAFLVTELLSLPVEPGEHGHRQTIVETMADHNLVAALGTLGAALQGAGQKLVRQPETCMAERRRPAEREHRARLALAQ